jgi:hypothetical protein
VVQDWILVLDDCTTVDKSVEVSSALLINLTKEQNINQRNKEITCALLPTKQQQHKHLKTKPVSMLK